MKKIDYADEIEKADRKHIIELKKHIHGLQNKNTYPEVFQFPVTLQYELTSECNLNCIHCYNSSGDGKKSRMNSEIGRAHV